MDHGSRALRVHLERVDANNTATYSYVLKMRVDGRDVTEQFCPNDLRLTIEAMAHADMADLKSGDEIEFAQKSTWN